MDTTRASASAGGRRSIARVARGWACALGISLCLAPGALMAENQVVAAEEEAPAALPFQLPAASASAAMSPGEQSVPLFLLLLSGMLVAGTLSALFRSLSQRDAHPAPSQRW
jgi:hypothetical protein